MDIEFGFWGFFIESSIHVQWVIEFDYDSNWIELTKAVSYHGYFKNLILHV